jgi:hypothetical protein
MNRNEKKPAFIVWKRKKTNMIEDINVSLIKNTV